MHSLHKCSVTHQLMIIPSPYARKKSSLHAEVFTYLNVDHMRRMNSPEDSQKFNRLGVEYELDMVNLPPDLPNQYNMFRIVSK